MTFEEWLEQALKMLKETDSGKLRVIGFHGRTPERPVIIETNGKIVVYITD